MLILFLFFCSLTSLNISNKRTLIIGKYDYLQGTFEPQNASNYLISKANDSSIINYNDGNKVEMYVLNYEAIEQTAIINDL